MTKRYQQFLGSMPGAVVEIIDDKASPYLVRTDDGFEFYVSAEDFRNYYKPLFAKTPERWRHLITEPEIGMVDSKKAAVVMEIIHAAESWLNDYDKARNFVRQAMLILEKISKCSSEELRLQLEKLGWNTAAIPDSFFEKIRNTPSELANLLKNSSFAIKELYDLAALEENNETLKATPELQRTQEDQSANSRKGFHTRLKNIEMTTEGDWLTIKIDLSKEFGPSKSGKTTIIASTEGNKTIPGRVEKIGLNVYRKQNTNSSKGRRKSFKNVETDIHEDILTLKVDLSKEFGPSKSGKTIIVASTEGNQLIYGRSERIGLNVYRKIDN